MAKNKVCSWKKPLKCKQLDLKASTKHLASWKQPSCQTAITLNSTWKNPALPVLLPAPSNDAVSVTQANESCWKKPLNAGPAVCSFAGASSVSVTSTSMQLASQSDHSMNEIPLSKAAQKGTDPNRLRRVLQSRCRCNKDCHNKFNLSDLKRLCAVFWKLTKNEQEHLDAHSAVRDHFEQPVLNLDFLTFPQILFVHQKQRP